MQRSLTDPQLVDAVDAAADFRILPDATVIKIGGQSVIDRGRAAVYPLVDEIVSARKLHSGKSQNEVRKLIAGPTVFICDEW